MPKPVSPSRRSAPQRLTDRQIQIFSRTFAETLLAKTLNGDAQQIATQLASPLVSLPSIGTLWPGQGGRNAGLILGENGSPGYAIVAADVKYWPKGAWTPRTRLTGAESEYDGLANTKAMAAAGNEAAKQALALTIDGHNDLYIASKFEERLVQLNRAAPGFTGWAWSSTQDRANDVYAWAQYFDDGYQYYYLKADELPFVLVRRFPFGNSIIRQSQVLPEAA